MKNLVYAPKLHKNCTSDVLIYEPDIVLISLLTIDEFNTLSEKNTYNDNLLNFNYIFCPKRNIYRLRTLPSIIEKKTKNELLSYLNINNFYESLPNEDELYLTSIYVPLHVEEALRQVFFPDIAPINSEDKEKISKLQKTAPVHSYFLFNNTKDEYFYKKKHEHVPGMMLIEAARQAVYDYVYTHSGHVLKEVSISMSNLNVEFLDYTVSSYPIELLFSHKEYESRYKPKNIDKKAWFYQRGKLTGTFSLEGGVIPMSIFPRLRNEKYSIDHHFYPFDDTYIKLKNYLHEEKSHKIIYLSLKHITIEATTFHEMNISEIILENDKFPIKEFRKNKDNDQHYDLFFEKLSKDQILILNNVINSSYFNKSKFKYMGI